VSVAYHYSAYGLPITVNKSLELLNTVDIINYSRDTADKIPHAVSIDLSNSQAASKLDLICAKSPSGFENGIKTAEFDDWLYLGFVKSNDETLGFYINKKNYQIVSTKPASIPNYDIDSFLLGPILGCVSRLLNRICLHASVLEFRGKAFAFVGDKGAGKSTTAAALLQAGANLVADDIAVFNSHDTEHVEVNSGYPAIRLCSSVLPLFDLDAANLRLVTSGTNKFYVPLLPISGNSSNTDSWSFKSGLFPLSKIYVLNPRRKDLETVTMTSLTKQQAAMSLIPHSYGRRVISNQQRRQEFNFMSELSQRIPIVSLERPDDLAQLSQVASTILTDVCNDKT